MDNSPDESDSSDYFWGEYQSSDDYDDSNSNSTAKQTQPVSNINIPPSSTVSNNNNDDEYYYYYDDDLYYYSDDNSETPEEIKKEPPSSAPKSSESNSFANKSIDNLPSYKPKNTGKGFSSNSSDEENIQSKITDYYSDESDIESKSVSKDDKKRSKSPKPPKPSEIIPASPSKPSSPSKLRSPDKKCNMKHFNRRRSSNFKNRHDDDNNLPNSPDVKSKTQRRRSIQTKPDGSKYARRRSRGSPRLLFFDEKNEKKSPVKQSILEEKIDTPPAQPPTPIEGTIDVDSIDINSVDPKIRDVLLKYKSENQKLSKENIALNIRLKRLKSQSPSPSQENLPAQMATVDSFKNVELKKICLLGRGATSKVIEVEDIKTEKRYAKKVLFKEFLNVDGIKHFIAEFELLRYLSHPCTAKVFGFDMDLANQQNPASIYFEVLQVSLSQAIDASTSLSRSLEHSVSENITLNTSNAEAERQLSVESTIFSGNKLFTNTFRARSLVEICCGMEFVHDCGIIHRDLKAENILLNETLNAKICDFGIAQLQSAEKLTKNVGTLFYMSPEILSEKNYGKETDVYSFGILAYFVFTGMLPKISLTKKVSGESVPEIPEFVTPLAREIITKCCQFEPSQRPTFTQVIELMKQNDFKLFHYSDLDFVKKRYEELMDFKKKHPAQLIRS